MLIAVLIGLRLQHESCTGLAPHHPVRCHIEWPHPARGRQDAHGIQPECRVRLEQQRHPGHHCTSRALPSIECLHRMVGGQVARRAGHIVVVMGPRHPQRRGHCPSNVEPGVGEQEIG
ncbi:MAG: hypothetical protein VXZ35_14415 [Pseudomonadota bacterium]|nr:hypothetical protein [Pseudomonadota bacterium]